MDEIVERNVFEQAHKKDNLVSFKDGEISIKNLTTKQARGKIKINFRYLEHESISKFEWVECGNILAARRDLKRYVIRKHVGVLGVECEYCGRVYWR